MSKKIKRRRENKAIDYPVIYSYIYEREKEDIIRLAERFKNTRNRKSSKESENRIIVGYKIENGKAVPIYQSQNDGQKIVALRKGTKAAVVKSGVTVKRGKATNISPSNTKVKSTSKK